MKLDKRSGTSFSFLFSSRFALLGRFLRSVSFFFVSRGHCKNMEPLCKKKIFF